MPVDHDVSALFGHLLVRPSPHETEMHLGTQPRGFVFNREAGRALCSLLESASFFALSKEVQLQLVTGLDVGLSAGHCSAIRLRLSCEGGQLVGRLLELLKIAARSAVSAAHASAGSGNSDDYGHLKDVLGRVLGMVCKAGIGVHELKELLRDLRIPSASTPPLLDALSLMTRGAGSCCNRKEGSENRGAIAVGHRNETVESIFDFGGDGAGLMLPVAHWPLTQEYQLAAWVKVVNSARSRSGATPEKAATTAHLFTFTTEAGAGVDFYLQATRLFVAVADGNGSGRMQPKVVDLGEMGISAGGWHALVISHRRSSTLLFNRDLLEVFLDGQLFFSASVPYPRNISGPLAQCSIGWNFDGQTSGILILSGVADLKIVESMLGRLAGQVDTSPNARRSLHPDLDLWDETVEASAKQKLKRRLLGSKYKIFAALLPSRTINNVCLEPHNGHHGRLMGVSTHFWRASTPQDVLRSIGGTASLLALAHGLLADTPELSLGREIPTSIGKNVDTVLSVLLYFLDGNVANQGDFFFAGGVEILELLLQYADERTFSSAGAHTVIVLEKIFRACRSDSLSSYIDQAWASLAEVAYRPQARILSLEQQILVCLYANFPLWSRAPPEFQFGLVTSVLDVVREAPGLFRKLLSLEAVLAGVGFCCPDRSQARRPPLEGTGFSGVLSSDTTCESSTAVSESSSSTHQGWTRMARRERLYVRGFLWELVRLLLDEEASEQDGIALAHFIASCDDTQLVCELVEILGVLMRKPMPPAGLFWNLENASHGHEGGHGWRESKSGRTPMANSGFVHLLLERCVLVNGASEDIRVAGLRAANVFMARSANANEREVRAGGDESMHSKGLLRDRHTLGEATYAALLEMALLEDERDLPWSQQHHVVRIIEGSSRTRRYNNDDVEPPERPQAEGDSARDDDLDASVWWDCNSRDGGVRRGDGPIHNDAQLIRNVLPLALILQYLPTMAKSVQVRSHGDLLLMLKLRKENRQKLMELSNAHGGKFWGIWQRCMFLMMAPLFSRGKADSHSDAAGQHVDGQDGERNGDYLMVLRLYALLLQHVVSFDWNGYTEIAVASSLQHLIPHGRVAVRVLLAQLAFEVGQNPESFTPAESFPEPSSDGADPEGQGVESPRQPLWNNLMHLAFISADLISEDAPTVTLGLFPEVEGVGRGGGLPGDDLSVSDDFEGIRASTASSSIPFLLCSSPGGHASLALSARVLGIFGELSSGASSALAEMCAVRTVVSGQGPLMFPLLRLSIFLLVRIHPFTEPAQENVTRLASLMKWVLSDGWRLRAVADPGDSDDMCIVVLAHVHAALSRLKHLAMTVGGTLYSCISEAREAVAVENSTSLSVRLLPVNTTAAYEYGRALVVLLRYITNSRLELLRSKLGERLLGALQEATTIESHEAVEKADTADDHDVPGQHKDQARWRWDNLLRSLEWMEGSFLFSNASDGAAALLKACMPSLKAAEEMESRAVREAGERTRNLQERASLTALGGRDALASADRVIQILEITRNEAFKAEALREKMEVVRRLDSRRRLQCCLETFSAAWSPWAARDDARGCDQPRGWKVSSHKDELMRQMLLVPVNEDVGHTDAAYAGTTQTSQPIASEDARDDTAVVSGVQPSRGFLDNDDEEEAEKFVEKEHEVSRSKAEYKQRPDGTTFGHRGTGEGSTEWEHVPRPSAVQAEVAPEAVKPTANEDEWKDVQQVSSAKGPSRVFGKWAATQVRLQGTVQGILYLHDESLVFESGQEDTVNGDEARIVGLQIHERQPLRWRLERLTQLHLRRFLLRPKAVELFWADSPEVFFAFHDVTERQAFTRVLRKRSLPMLPVITRQGILHPRKVLKACRITEAWRRREMSNFEYIMALNVIAGRSYNDISQYPVFPWVLADYTSSELDLSDPASFRDLSKPVGALNERRRQLFLQRYSSFEDDMVPKFMYGTHYSSAGIVLHYLVRQDPFTTLHVNLQGGRFDCPDRLFSDVGKSWKGCVDENSMSDVKELMPEFFCFPEMFLNSSKLPLGEMQDGTGAVDDVRLPPWAKDAFDFVRIHRMALESEHVSQNLHHWIDLVFGYQQRGDEAVKAANVFYYLTYEGAVDLSLVSDACQREAMEAQIRHFGQTPSQVLKEPHPIRLPPEECVLPIFGPTSTLASLRVFSAGNRTRDPRGTRVLLVYCTLDCLVSVDAALEVTTWAWSGVPDGAGLPFTLGRCKSNFLPCRTLHMSTMSARTSMPSSQLVGGGSPSSGGNGAAQSSRNISLNEGSLEKQETSRYVFSRTSALNLGSESEGDAGIPCVPARTIGRVHSCFGLCTTPRGSSESILSCGYWDDVVRVHCVRSPVKLALEGSGTGGHQGAINCLAIAAESSLMVTGGEDATCRVWVVGNAAMASALGGNSACGLNATNGMSSRDSMVCVHVLYGHEAAITCIAVSEGLDAVVSGASDGRIVLHCLKDGYYVRQYHCGVSMADGVSDPTVEASQLVFSCHGDVVAHSWTDFSLQRFSLNGTRLAKTVAPTAMNCLLTAGEGNYLLAGGHDGMIRVYTLHDLCVIHTIDLEDHGGITCMRFSPNDEYLLAGSQDGEVSIITDARIRMRMLDVALRRAFVG